LHLKCDLYLDYVSELLKLDQFRLFRNDSFIKCHTQMQKLVIPACNFAKFADYFSTFSPVFSVVRRVTTPLTYISVRLWQLQELYYTTAYYNALIYCILYYNFETPTLLKDISYHHPQNSGLSQNTQSIY